MTNMQQFWIFGYGSLMWNPGFDYVTKELALVRGYHRRLCVRSFIHRGTPEKPGLVLGLDRGGSCHGLAFRVDPGNWDRTLAYLRSREQVTSVYLERNVRLTLLEHGSEPEAVTYVVDRSHVQFTGKLEMPEITALIQQGEGVSGRCRDYVMNTVAHLREMNIHDARLEFLVKHLDG